MAPPHPYPPLYQTGYRPPQGYVVPPERPRPRRRTAEAGEPADYPRQLEEEIAGVRRDLDELRRSKRAER